MCADTSVLSVRRQGTTSVVQTVNSTVTNEQQKLQVLKSEMRNAETVLIGMPKGKTPLRISRRR
jgi:hypothetical protein